METIERELKFTLNGKPEFERLLSALPQPKQIMYQENIFFDTPARTLSDNGWALRVRLETDQRQNTQAEITAKGLSQGKEFFSERPEISSRLELSTATCIIAGGFDLLALSAPAVEKIRRYAAAEKLIPLVSFKNTRSTVPFPERSPFCFLEIDETFFSESRVDYELEIELQDREALEKACREIRKFLDEHKIHYQPGKKSKLERALELSENSV